MNHFAADLDPIQAKVTHATQQPLAGSAFAEILGDPAWRHFPSWYLVATQDQAVPPEAQRLFARRMDAVMAEVASSHVVMVSNPDQTVQLLKTAVESCAVPA